MKTITLCFVTSLFASTAFAALPYCQQNNIKVTTTLSDAAMCHSIVYYQIENQSNQTCQLTGYPQVMTLSAQGKKARVTTHKDMNYFVKANKPSTIILQPKSNTDRFAWFGVYGVCPDAPTKDGITSIQLRTSNKGLWSPAVKYSGYPIELSITAYQAGQHKEQ